MFTAALGSPRPPSDPCGVYHVFLVQTVKLHGAFSPPPCRGLPAACLLQGAVGWWCSGGILLSPAGHPQHGLWCCSRSEVSTRHDLVVTAEEEGAHLRFSLQLCSSCGFSHLSAMFFSLPQKRGICQAHLRMSLVQTSSFRLVWTTGNTRHHETPAKMVPSEPAAAIYWCF